MPENQEKRCVISYRRGWINSRICYGDLFDELKSCCDTFKNKFFNTGNEKRGTWGRSDLSNERPGGINLVKRGGTLKLLLCGESINFCPWCASAIEIKKSKDVTLKDKTKVVDDGLEEADEVGVRAAG
jgi:hypothetical protein